MGRWSPSIWFVLSLSLVAGCSPTLQGQLEKFGYAEIRPASTLTQPGCIAVLVNEQPYELGLICPPERAFGAEFREDLIRSTAADSRIARELSSDFTLDTPTLEYIRGQARFSSVEKVTLSMTNVRLIEVPDDAVFRHAMNRDPACREAIQMRHEHGYHVTLVRSVIQADVLYHVEYRRGIDVDVRAELTRELAGQLGIDAEQVSTESFGAEGLFWGIRDDQLLARIDPTDGLPPVGTAAVPEDERNAVPAGTLVNVRELP